MLSGAASTVARSEPPDSLRLDVDSLEIKDTECFPQFRCIHIDFPGKDILQATLTKYRKKPLLLGMVNAAFDFDASDEDVDTPLFKA